MVRLEVKERARNIRRDSLCAKVIIFVVSGSAGRRNIDLIIVADVIGRADADNLALDAHAIAVIRQIGGRAAVRASWVAQGVLRLMLWRYRVTARHRVFHARAAHPTRPVPRQSAPVGQSG